MSEILDQMLRTVDNGLHSEGMLPGLLNMQRVANDIYKKAEVALDPAEKKTLLLTAYAYACAEENADGNKVYHCSMRKIGCDLDIQEKNPKIRFSRYHNSTQDLRHDA